MARAKQEAKRRRAFANERGRDFIPRKRRKAQDAKDEPKAASDATMTKRRKRMKRRETTQANATEKRRRTMEEEEDSFHCEGMEKGGGSRKGGDFGTGDFGSRKGGDFGTGEDKVGGKRFG